MKIAELKIWHNQKPTQKFVFLDCAADPKLFATDPAQSPYGSRIKTEYMVEFNGRKRRVYCANYGNAGTLYIGKPGRWIATVESLIDVSDAEFNAFHSAYIEALFFRETIGGDGNPLDSDYDSSDLSKRSETKIRHDCLAFYAMNHKTIQHGAAPMGQYYDGATDAIRKAAYGGHDFYMTRQGHGVGFWESEWSIADPNQTLDKAATQFHEFHTWINKGKVEIE